jgi:dipeptidyl aminopeptidase/acylaminoacyl peptidase
MTTPADRVRARFSPWAVLTTICFGWAAGCQEDKLLVTPPPPPPGGKLLVTVITTGGGPDVDGYHLIVDQGAPIVVALSDEVSLTLAPGSHTIELADVAANCAVSGTNSRVATVASSGTSAVTFAVFCPVPGTIRVSTATSGPSPDPDGYLVSLDGAPRGPLGPQGVLDIDQVHPGSYILRLSSVAGNCSIPEGNSRYVTVAEALITTVLFTVTCTPRIDDTPGEKLVVSSRSYGDDDYNLYIMETDGSGSQRLTDNIGDEFSPEISPDGNRILFLIWTQGGRSLRVLDRVSRQETVLPTQEVDRAIWSPDGSRIAFVRGGRLFQMKSDGSQESAITFGTDDHNPYWSPDGARIVFTRGLRVFLVNADGSGLRQVSDEPRLSGPWSPDGRSIVLTRLRESCDYSFYYCYYYGPSWINSDLVVFDVASGAETDLTQTPGTAEWSPVWAADGQRIFFLFASGGNPDVYAIRLDGSPAVNLTASPALESWISIGRVLGATSARRLR